MLKKSNGITIITLIISIIILVILSTVSVIQAQTIINKASLQTLNTNMLLVQAKAKIVEERNNFDEQANPLKGQEVKNLNDNNKINKLKEQGVISETEEHYDDYYLWDQEMMYELELNTITLKDAFYIVNYKTEEVIFSDGFKYNDGKVYYKLSDTLNLK